MVDIDGATTATIVAGDKINFLDITDSLVKEDTVQGILDLVPAGGGWGLVESVNITSGTNITTFSHTVAAGYDYLITCRAVEWASDGDQTDPPMVQLGSGGGPTFITSAYKNAIASVNSASTPAETYTKDTITDGMAYSNNLSHGGTGANEFMAFTWEFLNPSAAEYTFCASRMFGLDNDAAVVRGEGACVYPVATAITALRIDSGSTNFDLAQIELMRRSIT